MSTFNLSKGSSFNLTKEAPSIKVAGIGLGWSPSEADADLSALCLGEDGHIVDMPALIFYGSETKTVLEGEDLPRPYSTCGGVYGAIDELEGEPDDEEEELGDIEDMWIHFDRVSADIKEILIVATIHDDPKDSEGIKDFSKVNGYCRVWDQDSDKELCRYNFSESVGSDDSIEVAKFSRDGDDWKFVAIGNYRNGGLNGFIKKYAFRF
jgi:tellurium resistance protein TerD